MRDALTKIFSDQISPFKSSLCKIAIVGGSIDEPEWKSLGLKPLSATLYNLEPTGFEREFQIDLNSDTPARMHYDLVICNQVLEHVWNHNRFFQSITSLVSSNGLLWVSAPSSNFEHGSPDYFAAGYTDTYLANNLAATGFEIVSGGSIASKRCYLSRHMFGYWISASEAREPLRNLPIAPVSGMSAATRLKKCLLLLGLALIRESEESRWAVESWVLARNPN